MIGPIGRLALTAQRYQGSHRISRLVIGKISYQNRKMLEILWWVSYLCSDDPDNIETHSPQSWASFNMLGEFNFLDEKLQDTIGVLPPKTDQNHLRKLGGAKSMIYTPFQ